MGPAVAQDGLNLAQDDEAEMETALLKAHFGRVSVAWKSYLQTNTQFK